MPLDCLRVSAKCKVGSSSHKGGRGFPTPATECMYDGPGFVHLDEVAIAFDGPATGCGNGWQAEGRTAGLLRILDQRLSSLVSLATGFCLKEAWPSRIA